MEPSFKEACEAIHPFFDVFANQFETELRNGVFMGDCDDFIKAKNKVDLINQMKQTLKNVIEGDSL